MLPSGQRPLGLDPIWEGRCPEKASVRSTTLSHTDLDPAQDPRKWHFSAAVARITPVSGQNTERMWNGCGKQQTVPGMQRPTQGIHILGLGHGAHQFPRLQEAETVGRGGAGRHRSPRSLDGRPLPMIFPMGNCCLCNGFSQ